MTTRMLTPAAVTSSNSGVGVNVNSHLYVTNPPNVVDVADSDVAALQGLGWVKVAPSGPTSGRMTAFTANAGSNAGAGFTYFDSTLGKVVCFDGVAFRARFKRG